MGAWGEGPLDSDGALDWIGNSLTDHLGAQICVVRARDVLNKEGTK